jgi:PTS system nitrogen regulatory IIA component
MVHDSHETFSLDELARQLGRDRREIERLVERGRIPGRKVSGAWVFHSVEITHWLEQEMRAFTDRELQIVEESQRSEAVDPELPVSSLLHPETCEVPLDARS